VANNNSARWKTEINETVILTIIMQLLGEEMFQLYK